MAEIASALASALLHSLWQDALLGLAAALALRAMARSSAALRHHVAMAFLVAMVMVPGMQLLLPWQGSDGPTGGGLVPGMGALGPSTAMGSLVQEASAAAPVVTLLWLLGVGLMLTRHVAALRALRMIERLPCRSLPPAWLQRVDAMRGVLGIRRAVTVRVSDAVAVPFAARLLRPAVWLPLSLLTRAPADQIAALLAHELAHIARKDWLWNGVQCAIEALLFFHPAIWWLSRRIRREREHACDDLAVRACGDAVALAEALAALACARRPSSQLVLAANGGPLMQRITRLLVAPPSRGRWGALALIGALTLSGAVLAAQAALAGGRFPDLQVTASTAGPLAPGDFREIKARVEGKQRYYRESVDRQGRRTRVYEENGVARPIDAGVARWVEGIERMRPPAPPLPPAPPPPPDVAGTPEVKGLMALIAADSTVVARVGAGARPTPKAIDGMVHHEGANGGASIHVEMQGPKGRALVGVEADMRQRTWTLERVTVQ